MMKDFKRLGKALIIIVAVMMIPITLVAIIRLHQYQQTQNEAKQQQNAVTLLVEIESDYNDLNDMLIYFCENYSADLVEKELDKNNLEQATYIFMRRGIEQNNYTGHFAWTFITQKYEILHRNIANYNQKVTDPENTIKNIDDVPRVITKFKGSI